MKDITPNDLGPQSARDPDRSEKGKTIDRMIDPKQNGIPEGRRAHPTKMGRHGTDKETELNPEE